MTGAAARLGRLWRTVRWLKPGQVLGRLRLRLQRPRPELHAAPARRKAGGAWVPPPARAPSLLAPTRLRFLAEEHDLDQVGWDDPAVALLWRYNLHYFDDLNAAGAASRSEWQRTLVRRWCDENPPGRGTAWAPYPTSLRIVNWVKWFSGGQSPHDAWLHSLAVQARWLVRRLEWHLLGNHLFANAKALILAGLFFEGAEAERWLDTGLALVERELPEQFLADGAQFERSPMYHALALEDLLDLLNAIAALAPPGSGALRLVPPLRQRSSAALHWLRCLRHPGGALARFNDCAEGIAPAVDAIEAYAAALGIDAPMPPVGTMLLQASGYARLGSPAALAMLDVAPIGPDYLPGHAHADTLSFELSIGPREIIVNRGTSVYGTGTRRQLERGTAAHSTVQIGAHDSSEVWAGFRVGRRARVSALQMSEGVVKARHDGYRHLPNRPWHQRCWRWEARGLQVEDRVTPLPREPAVARYHLAPGLALRPEHGHWLVVDTGGAALASVRVEAGSAHVESWQHAQGFGLLVPAQTLAVVLDAQGQARVNWTW